MKNGDVIIRPDNRPLFSFLEREWDKIYWNWQDSDGKLTQLAQNEKMKEKMGAYPAEGSQYGNFAPPAAFKIVDVDKLTFWRMIT